MNEKLCMPSQRLPSLLAQSWRSAVCVIVSAEALCETEYLTALAYGYGSKLYHSFLMIFPVTNSCLDPSCSQVFLVRIDEESNRVSVSRRA